VTGVASGVDSGVPAAAIASAGASGAAAASAAIASAVDVSPAASPPAAPATGGASAAEEAVAANHLRQAVRIAAAAQEAPVSFDALCAVVHLLALHPQPDAAQLVGCWLAPSWVSSTATLSRRGPSLTHTQPII